MNMPVLAENPALRKAIAMAVDYEGIIANAMTNQSPTFEAVPRSIMNPTAGEQGMYDQAAVADLQWAGNDIEGANALLDEAGLVDTDGDGIPDEFEVKHGLEPLKDDANDYDLDPKKYYTNLEVYANSLVEDIVKSERELAEASFDEYYPDLGKTSGIYQFVVAEGANTLEYLDGAKIVLNGNNTKLYTAGSEVLYNGKRYKSIKLSNGAQNTFYAPEGKGIGSVKIISYKHGSGTRTTFWYEVNGVEYGTAELTADDKMLFTPNAGVPTISEVAVDKYCATPNVQEFTIGGKPNFTFTNGGEQVAFILDVTYSDVVNTGISNVVTSKPQKVRKYYENGRIVIETANGRFTTTGARLK